MEPTQSLKVEASREIHLKFNFLETSDLPLLTEPEIAIEVEDYTTDLNSFTFYFIPTIYRPSLPIASSLRVFYITPQMAYQTKSLLQMWDISFRCDDHVPPYSYLSLRAPLGFYMPFTGGCPVNTVDDNKRTRCVI